MQRKLSILHVIHDFLPRHSAGSEIYAYELCRHLLPFHDVRVLCAEFDPSRLHGSVAWREYRGVSVVEIVNNWEFDSFEETYSPAALTAPLKQVLQAVQPDVLHIHNLFNLSMELPALARAAGIPSVATLHDYTLVCPSGGQRVHVDEEHVCDVIDPRRCSRCFPQSGIASQITPVPRRAAIGETGPGRLASWIGRRFQSRSGIAPIEVSPDAISARLEKAKSVFDAVDVFVAPSHALASEYRRLGIAEHKLRVSDYGFVGIDRIRRPASSRRLRIGFVGTLVWHKGAHVLVEAARRLPPDTYDLKIFGDPTIFWKYSKNLQERSAGLPVHFMGAFDNAQRAAVYGDLDVLVVPSLWPENSPLVIHEAFMAGVAVVASRQGGIPELVTDGVNGITYDAFSAEALTAALRQFIDDRGLAERYAARLPEVKPIEQDAREWDAIYQSVAAPRMARVGGT
jgi:glycosyltransferase involved in cell wall biosynthesis